MLNTQRAIEVALKAYRSALLQALNKSEYLKGGYGFKMNDAGEFVEYFVPPDFPMELLEAMHSAELMEKISFMAMIEAKGKLGKVGKL